MKLVLQPMLARGFKTEFSSLGIEKVLGKGHWPVVALKDFCRREPLL